MDQKLIREKSPEIGKIYRVEYNGNEIYDAKVINYDGGCWAKVKIENIISKNSEIEYREGQEFDMKLAYYKLYDINTISEKIK